MHTQTHTPSKSVQNGRIKYLQSDRDFVITDTHLFKSLN